MILYNILPSNFVWNRKCWYFCVLVDSLLHAGAILSDVTGTFLFSCIPALFLQIEKSSRSGSSPHSSRAWVVCGSLLCAGTILSGTVYFGILLYSCAILSGIWHYSFGYNKFWYGTVFEHYNILCSIIFQCSNAFW